MSESSKQLGDTDDATGGGDEEGQAERQGCDAVIKKARPGAKARRRHSEEEEEELRRVEL